MIIPFTEPTEPRYIYINPTTNTVHLLVPVVSGEEIGTDNTCQSTAALDKFFQGGAALRELNAYKAALEFDLQLLVDSHPLQARKQHRLTQINAYIKALTAMRGKSSVDIITPLMQERSNLYSIQLRPHEQDIFSRVINPIFSINRGNNLAGEPSSALYNAMYATYPRATIAAPNPKKQLENAVLEALDEQPVNFQAIQTALTNQCHAIGLAVDFTLDTNGKPVSQASIDTFMRYPANSATTKEYMDALLYCCARNMWADSQTPPFYSVQNNVDRTDKLSILTQFFLANVNIYCAANGISQANFGKVLDESPVLSADVARRVTHALSAGAHVEEDLCAFVNLHALTFSMNRRLIPADINAIQQKFDITYRTVTAMDDNSHMDDFLILDTTAQTKIFVNHQGAICTDFAELVAPSVANTWANWLTSGFGLFRASLNNAYFQTIRAHYEALNMPVIPHKNQHIHATIELSIEELIANIKDDEQFTKLPIEILDQCLQSPAYQQHRFLHDVAKGRQDNAAYMLTDPATVQTLLTTAGTFTDYSGRIFSCTAYEYAYWTMDTHMCRMLEARMDDDTKADMFAHIDAMEGSGLTYKQHDKVKTGSKHFDLTPLKTALNRYVQGYDVWDRMGNYTEMKSAWMTVGLAQRDLPAHVLHEYCRPDRSFGSRPEFNEQSMPRVLTLLEINTSAGESLFPLSITSSGLSVDFAFMRGGDRAAFRVCRVRLVDHFTRAWLVGIARMDFLAASHLKDVKAAECPQLRENLMSAESTPGMSC